jgi:uncharacterized protein YndB with AHSA1/START domain
MMAGVEIRKSLKAAPEKVFAAFADAVVVARWLKPSPDIELSVLQFDFREGGTYRFAYRVPGVATPMIVFGAYSVIQPPSRIVFSWIIEPPDEHAGIESEVSVTISRSVDSTQLVIRHDRLARPDAEQRHRGGWEGAVEQLADQLGARS